MFEPTIWRLGRLTDPLSEMQRLQRDMNRLFTGITERTDIEFPAVNVWLGAEDAILTAELPGMDPAKMDISVVADNITISGSRDAEAMKEGESYHRQERNYNRFSRTLQLPFDIDPGKVEAKYEKGVLRITMGRAENDKPKKVTIKAE